MSEWETNKLEDITIFIKDGTHGTHKDVPNGIPLLSAKDVENGKILIPADCRTISENDYDKIHANYELQDGDIVLTIVGTIGRVAIIKNLKKRITFQRSVGIIRFNENSISSDYSFYYFQADDFQRTLERAKNASAQGGVYLGSLVKASIYHPSDKLEQSRISTILFTVDAVIEKTQATIDKYKAIKQGMLHDLFTRGIDPTTGKLRPKYENSPTLYKESKLGMVPREWDEKALVELTTQIGDGIHTTPQYSENTDFYFINGNNLKDGEIDIKDSTLCISEEEYKKHFKELNDRTILYSINGTIGNIAFYNHQKVILGKSACYISCKQNVNLDYIFFILQSDPILKFYEIEMTGSTIKNLSLDSVRNTPITIPKDDREQELIAKRVRTINDKLDTEQSYLRKLQQIKAGLMSDLLSGRKRVSVSEEVIAVSN